MCGRFRIKGSDEDLGERFQTRNLNLDRFP